jgi:hypothetical protein
VQIIPAYDLWLLFKKTGYCHKKIQKHFLFGTLTQDKFFNTVFTNNGSMILLYVRILLPLCCSRIMRQI